MSRSRSIFVLIAVGGVLSTLFQNCMPGAFSSNPGQLIQASNVAQTTDDLGDLTPVVPNPDPSPTPLPPVVEDMDSTLSSPLYQMSQIKYQGAFRLPAANDSGVNYGTSTVYYSNGPIAYNPDNRSIFIEGFGGQGSIAEFKIPQIVNSRNLDDLNMASAPLQNFSRVLDRANIDVGEGIFTSGMYYFNKKLLVNVYRFYDQNPNFPGISLILQNASNLAASTVKGYLPMEGGRMAAGWVSPVPKSLQSILGGTHITGYSGSTGRATVFSSRGGPSAFAFNPEADMMNANINEIKTSELMSFTLENGLTNDMYNTDLSNKFWTFCSESSFGMIVPGTRTYMVLGISGGHNSGIAYGDPPYGGYKGYYPKQQNDLYSYYWLFDVNDFNRVKRGELKPYQIKPYAVGIFPAPFQVDIANSVGGGSYDPATKTLYLSIRHADGPAPVIVAYKFY